MYLQILLLIGCLTLGFVDSQKHILDEVPLVDGHNDLPYNIYHIELNDLSKFELNSDLTANDKWKACESCHTDLPRLRTGKVGSQFWVAYVSCQVQYKDALGKTLDQIDVIKRLVNKYPNDMQLVTTADGIMEAFTNNKIGSLIGVEGGHSMDSRLSVLRVFYDLGVRYMTLTHSCNTPWADNSYVDDTKPVHDLTDFGKLVVKEMNRLGMLVDLSHVSHAVMNAAIEVSTAPVIFSHSSAFTIFNHNRNVRDDTLALVKENKGIVMVNFYPSFISAEPTKANIQTVADHINHIAKTAGVDCVGIGADYDGVEVQPIGLEDVSKYPDLFDLLETNDPVLWTRVNLAKLASGNLIRVFKAVEKVRDDSKNIQPFQSWIPIKDLDDVDEATLWQCRTLLNNTSPQKDSANTNFVSFAAVLLTGLVAYLNY